MVYERLSFRGMDSIDSERALPLHAIPFSFTLPHLNVHPIDSSLVLIKSIQGPFYMTAINASDLDDFLYYGIYSLEF